MLWSRIAMGLTGVLYAALCLLFWHVAASFTQHGDIWLFWFACGSATLFSAALELAWLVLWLVRRALRLQSRFDLVPERLEPADVELLVKSRPRVVLFLPANKEAMTDDDAAALEDRLYLIAAGIVAFTRHCQVRVVVAYDTAESVGDEILEREQAVIRNVHARLKEANVNARVELPLDLKAYRNKPAARRSKQGSLELYLEQEAEEEFIMVLDADSSFPVPDEHPDTNDILDRLVAAMLRHDQLAMIQCAIRMPQYSTTLGWLQSVNARLAINYHGPLNIALLAPHQPSYGHNVLFRTHDLRLLYESRTPQNFLSHDFIEAAMLAASGRWCIHTMHAASQEEPEDTADGYIRRDKRWQRGNSQWPLFLVQHPRMPIGAWFSLSMGVLNYLLPFAASLFLIASAILLFLQRSIIRESSTVGTAVLIGLVILSLVGPKLAACFGPSRRDRPKLWELAVIISLGSIVAAPLALYCGISFVLGPAKLWIVNGVKRIQSRLRGERPKKGRLWKSRPARKSGFSPRMAGEIAMLFLPASLLGAVLTALVWESIGFDLGSLLVVANAGALLISPLTAIAVSVPLPGPHRPAEAPTAPPLDAKESVSSAS